MSSLESQKGENRWSDTPSAVNVTPFTEEIGPSIALAEEVETFTTLFTENLLEHMSTRLTHKYAAACFSAS
jgi:hypothetical protein